MIEPLLFGIVLGLIPVTLAGLFVRLTYSIEEVISSAYKNRFIVIKQQSILPSYSFQYE